MSSADPFAVVAVVAAAGRKNFTPLLPSADPFPYGWLREAPLPPHFQGGNLARGRPQPHGAGRDPQPPAQLLGRQRQTNRIFDELGIRC